MTDLFNFDKPPPLYAVMGNPVAHSRSPEIHQMFARQASLELEYQKIHVDVGGFRQAVSSFQAGGGQGLNITAPFKLEARQLCDVCSERAALAGAVNTLWFKDSTIHGDNTDGVGICTDIIENIGLPLSGKRLLVLGAGGAVRGVLGELLSHCPEGVVVANRTVDKAVGLVSVFAKHGDVRGCGFNNLKRERFDIIINGTAASLSGEVPVLPRLNLADDTLAYDMVYSTEPTAFMQWAIERGISRVSDGLGMLVEQAAESFRIWHRVSPQTGPVIRRLRGESGLDPSRREISTPG